MKVVHYTKREQRIDRVALTWKEVRRKSGETQASFRPSWTGRSEGGGSESD